MGAEECLSGLRDASRLLHFSTLNDSLPEKPVLQVVSNRNLSIPILEDK